MNKRSGHKHKRAAKKTHRRSGYKRTERKHKKSTRGYRKGSKSKTMKGKKDFTTKKTSKVFNRRRHYQKHAKGSRVIRRPYAKRGGNTTHHKPSPPKTSGQSQATVQHPDGSKATSVPIVHSYTPPGQNPNVVTHKDINIESKGPGGVRWVDGKLVQEPFPPAGDICNDEWDCRGTVPHGHYMGPS